MKKLSKPLSLFLLGAVLLVSGAGLASARGGGHFGGSHGQKHTDKFTPEAREALDKAHAALAPIHMELRAKQAELTAKIYSGADDKTIQELSREIGVLQAKLTEGRIAVQKQLVKAGVPLHSGGCFTGGPGGMHGMGGMGMSSCYGSDSGYGPHHRGMSASALQDDGATEEN